MDIQGSVALVTGANRGLGQHLAQELLRRGAAKVYATARNPAQITSAGVIPLALDINDAQSATAAAAAAPDVTLLINNAGNYNEATLLDGSIDDIRALMETHYFGTLSVTRAFAPLLVANAPAAILNVASVLSWLHPANTGAYNAAKAALWAQTDSVREQLATHDVTVTALHVGYMDTDMISELTVDKNDPALIAAAALDGVAAAAREVLADDLTRHTRASLGGDHT
ncbi:SDR family oxidoreductase [Mycolicibacterium hodleri]|uniref:SDR family NAD(P)-dependent oxidoreductase n=1 Tax=Mycolicibacterium hodleri TaxID=49897 RepID=A0A502EBK4_9MYCO|nr:SDR family oxidoreductase [Mycolicibacterium hodleri]TPG35043.1 SDR family NAD(P)-dependent oxidoreductase [Mycolicibacterium hodleri]